MTNKIQLVREMIEYIQKNHITNVCDLIDYAIKNHFVDWFKVLADNKSVLEMIELYIQSVRRKNLKERQETKYQD